ncbi:hypothetical protein HYX18_00560 [Candidatus Woesearchaeota archaeon]|nr:hypothetical protein [Candidatus Woesearchaeota archaeon]
MNRNNKLLIIILLVAIVLIGSCKSLIQQKTQIKSEKDASSATSNLTDTIDTVSTNLKDVSRTLGR